MKKQYYYYFLLVFFVYSCEKQVEIEFPKLKSKLVINGYICPDSVLKVNVSASSDFNDSIIENVNDAECKIFENDIFLFNLKNIGKGNYIAPGNYKPKEGAVYKIEVNHVKYDTVYSEDKVPEKEPVISNIFFKDIAYIDFEQYIYSQFYFDLKDNSQTEDYYELMIFARDDSVTTTESKYDYYVYLTTTDLVLINQGLNGFLPLRYLPFNDNLINGLKHRFTIDFGQCNKYYTIFLIILKTSKNYYIYHKSLIKHMNNQEGDFWEGEANPAVLFSNIKNGYGAFVAYNTFIDSCRNY